MSLRYTPDVMKVCKEHGDVPGEVPSAVIVI